MVELERNGRLNSKWHDLSLCSLLLLQKVTQYYQVSGVQLSIQVTMKNVMFVGEGSFSPVEKRQGGNCSCTCRSSSLLITVSF